MLLLNDIAYYAFNGVKLGAFAGKPLKSMTGMFSDYPGARRCDPGVGREVCPRSPGKRLGLGPPGSGRVRPPGGRAHPLCDGDRSVEGGRRGRRLLHGRARRPIVAVALASGKLALVGVGRTAVETLERKYPFYTMASSYKGEAREVATSVAMAMLVACAGLAKDLVYRFTKAVFDNLPQFHAAHPAARRFTMQTALVGMALPLHPGAERFFKEKRRALHTVTGGVERGRSARGHTAARRHATGISLSRRPW